ncbi:SCO4225 family membrane protein [Streptomyces sp. UNOB3_S3]|uniref:SCO4225 family membrane protein n=1 Tax=Streptomyces sp. UNOB3_S3 TaxID=2871682 RepID=UPI001E371363|nr:hypothetical protein [Streptomyces sp. UNOB3_S3]MCC3775066.1 hypothetical protein [Streptomyces sp. UNOB3_S3]
MVLNRTADHYSKGRTALKIAGGYAALVMAVTVFVVIAGILGPGSLAGVWLVVVTLPVSVLLQPVPAEGSAFIALLVLGGLLQSWALWILLRGRRID